MVPSTTQHQHNALPTGTESFTWAHPVLIFKHSPLSHWWRKAPSPTPAASEGDGTARNRLAREEWNKQGSDMEERMRASVVVSSWRGESDK